MTSGPPAWDADAFTTETLAHADALGHELDEISLIRQATEDAGGDAAWFALLILEAYAHTCTDQPLHIAAERLRQQLEWRQQNRRGFHAGGWRGTTAA